MVIDAYIPARSGSKGVPGKNTRLLCGHPLIAYTIAAALQASIFRNVIVTTDCQHAIKIAGDYGVTIHHRSDWAATDEAMDIDWLKDALNDPPWAKPDVFCILRPTSPFRTPETIRSAWNKFNQYPYASGLKGLAPAVVPAKMWVQEGDYIVPLINYPYVDGQPAYNCPRQKLKKAYPQSSAIDMGILRNITVRGDIYGEKILPFYMSPWETVHIDDEEDFLRAEFLVEKKIATLPII
jgi:CMP-N,N'-diacetyllegionaminic acid synthase